VKPAILCLFGPDKKARAKLEVLYRALGPYKDPLNELPSADAAEVRAVITTGGIGAKKPLLDLLPNLQLVCAYGAGYEGVDLAELKQRRIKLTNAQGGNAPCVADMAMALLLAVALRILPADRMVRDGKWDAVPPRGWPASPGIGGKRLGVVGLGEIGFRIAKRAQPFDLEIAYHNRTKRGDVAYRYFADLREMADWCDYLVVACPLNDSTRHAVNAKVLKALGQSGYLVNIGRGAVIDQPALIDALKNGVIAGAGLDVLEGEPSVPPELAALPNVVLTPHIAAMTVRSVDTLNRLVMENLAALFDGKPLVTPVRLD